MAARCAKCNADVPRSENVAKCTECKCVFHPSCTRVGSAQSFTKTLSKSWKCDSCVDETGSSASVRSNEDLDDKKSIFEALKVLKKDINKNTDEKFRQVNQSVNGLVEEMKQLRVSVSALEGTQKELTSRCDKLEADNQELSEEVQNLRLQVQDMEQRSRAANLEIVGVPLTAGENINTCLEKLATAIGVPYRSGDISIAHRLRLFSERHAHPPIIVQYVSRAVREQWLAAARKRRNLVASDIDPSLSASRVFINEHLTPANKALLGRARALQRSRKLHFAGYINGKVLIKTSEGANAVRVTSPHDLNQYTQ